MQMNVSNSRIARSMRFCRCFKKKTFAWISATGLALGLVLGPMAGLAQDPPDIEAGPVAVEKSAQNEAIKLVVHSYSVRSTKLRESAADGEAFLILRASLINNSSQEQTSVPDVQRAFSLQLAGDRSVPLHPLSADTADPFWGPIILQAGEELPVEMVFSVPAQRMIQASLFHLSSKGPIHLAVIGRLLPRPGSPDQPIGEARSGEVANNVNSDASGRPDITPDPARTSDTSVSVNERDAGVKTETETRNTRHLPVGENLSRPDAAFSRFAYVANFDDHTISAYTVDTETGALRHNGYVFSVAGKGPFWVATEPDGRFLFVANIENKTISVYGIHPTTGALTISGVTEVEDYPSAIAVHSAGKFLYVANEQSDTLSLYVINQRTGALRLSRALCTGRAPSSLTIDPRGRFLYVMNRVGKSVSLYPIDPRYGSISTPEGKCGDQVPAGQSPTSLAINPQGTFAYLTDTKSNAVSVYAVDRTTGKLEPVGDPVAAGLEPVWVAVHPSGRLAYVANIVSNDISIFRISKNGRLVHQDTIAAEAGPQSIMLDPRGSFAYVTNRDSNHVSVYGIDPRTGLLEYRSAVTARSWPRSFALVTGSEPILQSLACSSFCQTVSHHTRQRGGGFARVSLIEHAHGLLSESRRFQNGIVELK